MNEKKSLCQQTIEKLCDVLEFELGHVEGRKACEEVLEHIKNCPRCYAEVDTLRKTVRIFQCIPNHEVPKEVQWRLMTELKMQLPDNR